MFNLTPEDRGQLEAAVRELADAIKATPQAQADRLCVALNAFLHVQHTLLLRPFAAGLRGESLEEWNERLSKPEEG